MEAFQQLGQDLVSRLMAQPDIILGALVSLVMLAFGGQRSREAVADKAREAIVKAEEDLARTGQEKLGDALDLVLATLPGSVRPLAALVKPVIALIIQKVFDQEFSHYQRGSAAPVPVAQPVSVLEAEAERGREMLGGSVADTLLDLPARDDQ